MTGTDVWRPYAACLGAKQSTFFPEVPLTVNVVAPAKIICAKCPVSTQCLDEALELEEEFGIRGGMTPRERHAEMQRRGGRAVVVPLRRNASRCGTNGGYHAHRRRREEACTPCLLAHRLFVSFDDHHRDRRAVGQ